jgi:hypothetical protein
MAASQRHHSEPRSDIAFLPPNSEQTSIALTQESDPTVKPAASQENRAPKAAVADCTHNGYLKRE